MAGKAITFNSLSLQDSNFLTQDIIYRHIPDKIVNIVQKNRNDGFIVQSTMYSLKRITVRGVLSSDSEANLKTSIDSMKESLNVDEANLDIGDGGGTLRYVCSVESLSVPEEHYNITNVPYEISFVCQPFGKATSATTDTKAINQASTSPYPNTLDPTGSADPKPVLKWLCNGSPTAAITQIVFTNSTTGQSMTVASLAMDNANDYLEIDCNSMTVKVSHDGGAAAAIDYTGTFPDFKSGSNSYTVAITGGGATWALTQTIVYYPTYL